MDSNQKKMLAKLEEVLKGSFSHFSGTDPHQYWVVLLDGKRVIMKNGKSIWKQKNHASCAVSNCIEYSHWRPRTHTECKNLDWYENEEKVRDYWKKQHIEVVSLTEWENRGRP